MQTREGKPIRHGRRPRILIAEDDPSIRDVVLMRLSAAGYDVHTARTGSEALQRIVILQPDALLLDINMPELDGFGVLEALKNDLKTDVPVLMLTARRSEEDVLRALQLGARDYVAKSSLEAELLPRIARMLRGPKKTEAA